MLLLMIICLASGFVLLKYLFKGKRDLLFFVPISFLLGMGVVSWQLMIYSFVSINWTTANVSIPWVLSSTYLLISDERSILQIVNKIIFEIRSTFAARVQISLRNILNNKHEFALVVAIMFQVVFILLIFIVNASEIGGDAISIWFFKARAFFIDGYINPDFLASQESYIPVFGSTYYKSDYPLLYPLSLVWIFTGLGEFNIIFGKLLTLFLFSAVVTLFYWIVRNRTNRIVALLFTFLLISPQVIFDFVSRSYSGYADVPVSAFMIGSLAPLALNTQKNKRLLILSVILANFVALTKSEGVAFLFIILLLYPSIKSFLVTIFLQMPWYLFKLKYGISSYVLSKPIEPHFNKTFDILTSYLEKLFSIEIFNILWILIFISILVSFRVKDKFIKNVSITILFMLIFFFLFYFITPLEVFGQIESSADRLMFQIMPIAMIIPASVYFMLLKNKLK